MNSVRSSRTLAVLGGSPAFAEPLHVGRPNIGSRERYLARVEAILDRRWLTNNGPMVLDFEAAIRQRLGVRHCVCTSNATVALEIGARVLGLEGEVICPSFTFVATAHALQWLGIEPVFCDVDLDSHGIDPSAVEERITPRTTGVVGVHLWGRSCAIEQLEEICRRRGLRLMFDAAHAFACDHGGRWIGNFGDLEVLSFHATKCLNSFEGGAIVTNDDELAERARLLRNFGFAGFDRVVELGVNGKMPEVCAAMGLTNLESLDEVIDVNRRHYSSYAAGLAALPGLRVLPFDPLARNNYHYVVVVVDPVAAGLTRDEIVALLHAENVLARRYFAPGCHGMEPYRTRDPEAGRRLPNTEALSATVFCLPSGTAVGERDVATVVELLAAGLEASGAVRAALAGRSAR
ncbi:MAG: aminotransferase class I/II-fold pyridoxal phosphate-dependent enzyme [Holophagales bacterium]|nr:MAG: aminotransferase class I/II-fold pyridoxal phosphate-dependent enzyme [Holophagales bacterium]